MNFMSSRKAAVAKAARRPASGERATVKPAAAKPAIAKPAAIKPAAAKPHAVVQTGVSADAIRLANEIEQAFAKSDDALSMEAMQTLMGTLCRIYAVQAENGAKYTPIAEGQVVSPTAVMVTASGLLRAGNLAVFELGMWQSWTGR
jgi:hypothetical protein